MDRFHDGDRLPDPVLAEGTLTPELSALVDKAYLAREMKIERLKVSVVMSLTKAMTFFYYGRSLLAIVLSSEVLESPAVWKMLRPVGSKYPEECWPRSKFPDQETDLNRDPTGIYGVLRVVTENPWSSGQNIDERCWKEYVNAIGCCVDHISTKNGIPKVIEPALFIEGDLQRAVQIKTNAERFGQSYKEAEEIEEARRRAQASIFTPVPLGIRW